MNAHMKSLVDGIVGQPLLALALALGAGLLLGLLPMLYRQHRFSVRQRERVDQLREQLGQQRTELALAEQARDHLRQGLQRSESTIERQQQRLEQLQQALQRSETALQSLRQSLESERSRHRERLAELENHREQLKKEFESLAQQILKSAQQEFSTQSRDGLDQFLKPFREQIRDFRLKVEHIHSEELRQRSELQTELKQLQALNQRMTQEAHQLTTALKGQKKMQGNWGELVLENVLDRSGLRDGKDYRREVSFKTEDGRRRPDVIVYLPDDKHLVIDAKVSLNAYTRYVNAEDDLEREAALREHARAISSRIRELSERDYFELPGLRSPEMVFMFIPIESAFVEAIKADESLYQQAVQQRVLVTTPTTLLTSLNIVRQLWRFEDQNKHAARLAEQAGKVYNQLRLFLESMQDLGHQLDKSKRTYNKAMGQFLSGRGNLVNRVEAFQKLGVAVKKELPPELVEKAGMELDLIDGPSSPQAPATDSDN
jgi:DNA recombination protein RmuC